MLGRGTANVVEAGDGPVLVAIHGLPGSTRDFRYLAGALEGQMRVVRVDLPGCGETPRGSIRLADRAAFVAQVLEKLELSRVLLLGHSMGGAVATAAAALSRERVAGLALVASVGFRPHRGLDDLPVPALLGAALGTPLGRRWLLPRVKAGFRAAGFRDVAEDQLIDVVRAVGDVDFAAHGARLSGLGLPTMIAWAQDDPLIEDAIGEELYWRSPAGPRVRFQTGGHALCKTRAGELAEALVHWRRSLG